MNILPSVTNQLYKFKSIELCSGIPGQILLDLCLNKPKGFGDEFTKKYNEGFNKNVEKIIRMKNSLLNDLQKDGKFEFRDIDGKDNFFICFNI